MLKLEGLLSIAAIGDDGLGFLLIQFGTQFCAIIGLIAKHLFGWLNSGDELLGPILGWTSETDQDGAAQ